MDVTQRQLIQVVLVHTVYALSPASLWLTIQHKAVEPGWLWHVHMWATVFLVNLLLQAAVGASAVYERSRAIVVRQWCQFHLLCFIALMMVPYMRTVEMIFRDAMIANSTHEAKLDKCPADLIVDIDDKHSIMTLVLFFGYLCYPFPERKIDTSTLLLLGIEFLNVYDILDLLKDLACIKYMPGSWINIQYVSMGISAVSISFSVDTTIIADCPGNGGPGDGQAEDEAAGNGNLKNTCLRILKLVLTIIFMNISFTVLRIRVMVEHEAIDSGVIMALKNVLLAILNGIYLVKQFLSLHRARHKHSVHPARHVGNQRGP